MKKIVKKWNNAYVTAGIAIFITVSTILCALKLEGIFPFGDDLLAYNDMKYQYVDFFMWMKNTFQGKDVLEYSYNFGMGGGTIGLYAYYLASPFNALMLLCPVERMAEGLTLLIILKLALCCLTTYIYLKVRFQIPNLYVLLLSVSYALMGWNILQCSNIMWLDGVIVFPLIALGIYQIIVKRSHIVYFFALAYGIFANWYIGYMLCLGAVIYFLFEMFLYYGEEKKKNRFRIWKECWEFGLTSVLGVLATFALFLPQTIFMAQEGEKFNWSIFSPSYTFSYLEGFRDLVLQPDKLTLTEGIPPIYIGSFVVLLVLLFFVSKKIPKIYKLISGIFLAGFMFVFMFRPLNYLFTAFKVPSGHHYRYAFIFSLLMVTVAGLSIQKKVLEDTKGILTAVGVWVGSILLFDMIQRYANTNAVYISILIAIVMAGILYSANMSYKQVYQVIGATLLVICLMVEFTYKMSMEFKDHTESATWYREYNKALATSVDELQNNVSTPFRIDKTFSRSGLLGNNEGMAFGYSSISQYSSANNVEVTKFLANMGYNKDQTLVDYSTILPIDSLLGDKYIYSREPVYGCTKIKEDIYDGIDIYENPYALSFGYLMEGQADTLVFGQNVFENHNILYSTLVGEEIDLYDSNEILSYQTDGSGRSEWEIKINTSGAVYLYCLNGISDTDVYVNDEFLVGNYWHNNSILYLGEYDAGNIIKVRVEASRGGYRSDYGVLCETLNLVEMEHAIKIMEETQCGVINLREKEMQLECASESEKQLMLTIPYEKGWNVEVNGQETQIDKIANAFIGVTVPKGKNEIIFKYHLTGKYVGIIISIVSITVFVIWEMLIKKQIREKNNEKR